MTNIETVILENSSESKAKLHGPAQKAFTNPETGVTIIKQGAARVIRDCAETTLTFLPIEIFLKYANPVMSLKGKFNVENVKDLFERSKTNTASKLLFNLLLETCPKNTIITTKADHNDPYGDYSEVQDIPVAFNAVDLILKTYS
jgi:hypothetical protein